MAQPVIPITFLELISTRNIKTSMKKKLSGNLLGAKQQSKKKLSNKGQNNVSQLKKHKEKNTLSCMHLAKVR